MVGVLREEQGTVFEGLDQGGRNLLAVSDAQVEPGVVLCIAQQVAYGLHYEHEQFLEHLVPMPHFDRLKTLNARHCMLKRLLDVLRDGNEETPDAALMAGSLIAEVQRALATLPARESQVLGLYFGLNSTQSMTLEEIGEMFNLTRERVRQIKEKATRRLKYAVENKALKAYLG